MKDTYYAVIQVGYPVFGVGKTADEATKEAEEWAESLDLVDEHEAVDGDMVLVECSKALHDAVQQMGGDVIYEIDDDGLYDLAK